jgi:UDP-N-acetylmuramate--alanine ligase
VSSTLVGDPLRALPGSRTVLVSPSREQAVEALVDAARPGDLLLTVGAGDVTALAPLLVQALRTRSEKVTR